MEPGLYLHNVLLTEMKSRYKVKSLMHQAIPRSSMYLVIAEIQAMAFIQGQYLWLYLQGILRLLSEGGYYKEQGY